MSWPLSHQPITLDPLSFHEVGLLREKSQNEKEEGKKKKRSRPGSLRGCWKILSSKSSVWVFDVSFLLLMFYYGG